MVFSETLSFMKILNEINYVLQNYILDISHLKKKKDFQYLVPAKGATDLISQSLGEHENWEGNDLYWKLYEI